LGLKPLPEMVAMVARSEAGGQLEDVGRPKEEMGEYARAKSWSGLADTEKGEIIGGQAWHSRY